MLTTNVGVEEDQFIFAAHLLYPAACPQEDRIKRRSIRVRQIKIFLLG
jgi:hypothetical protein